MNTNHSSAGVYTKIRDFSVLSVADSGLVVGMVGAAARGPVNEAFRTYSRDDWSDYYGKRDQDAYGFMGFCAHVIHQYSTRLYSVRLAPTAEYGAVHLTIDDPTAASPRLYLSQHTDTSGMPIGISSPDDIDWNLQSATVYNELGFFYAADPGAWNRNLFVFVIPNNPKGLDPITDRAKYDTSKFKVLIYENYVAGATADEEHVVTFDDYIGSDEKQYNIVDVLENNSKLLRFKRNHYCSAVPVVRSANSAFGSGSDGRLPTAYEIAQAYTDHFSDPEFISPQLLVNCMGFNETVHRAMDAAAKRHNNCRAMLNMNPDYQSVRLATNYRDSILNLDTYHSFLYCGDLRVFDSEEARTFYAPLVAWAAVAYARADFTRAPAGMSISDHINVLGARHIYTQAERNTLTDAQLNYVRKMPDAVGGGYALWEQLTLWRRASMLRNINVSALSGRILQVCHTQVIYGLFDPNDKVLRAQLVAKADVELSELNKAGAFNTVAGATPYQIICDATNNTSATIADGDLIMDIVIDPASPVRRLMIRYNLNPKGSTSTVITG